MGRPTIKPNGWSTSFFDCCAEPGGGGTCCYSMCCSPCLYGENVKKMPENVVCCGNCCFGACAVFLMLAPCCCSFLVHMEARRWLRKKYGIPGSNSGDCCRTFLCAPCALCQEHRELQIRGVGPNGLEYGQTAETGFTNISPPAPDPAAAANHYHPSQAPAHPSVATNPPSQQMATGYPATGYPASYPSGYAPHVHPQQQGGCGDAVDGDCGRGGGGGGYYPPPPPPPQASTQAPYYSLPAQAEGDANLASAPSAPALPAGPAASSNHPYGAPKQM